MSDFVEREKYRQRYKLSDECLHQRFSRFYIWCLQHKLIPVVKMNDYKICCEAIDRENNTDLCVEYTVDDYNFYGAYNFQQIIIEDMERLM